MADQEFSEHQTSLVEVIRDELRQAAIEERRNNRTEEQNKRRAALGELITTDDTWTLDTIIKKTKDLRKKALSIDDYIKLQNSLIQVQLSYFFLFMLSLIVIVIYSRTNKI